MEPSHDAALRLTIRPTARFGVVDITEHANRKGDSPGASVPSNGVTDALELPMLALEDLLWHSTKRTTTHVQTQLKDALRKHGFILIPVSNKQAVSVIRNLRESLDHNLFPNNDAAASLNRGNLATSGTTYISEKGVPMYKLGYELCEDRVREVFRVAGGSPDSVGYGCGDRASRHPADARDTWLRGLGLMRHVTDTALDLLLPNGPGQPRLQYPNNALSWWNDDPNSRPSIDHPLPDRVDDFSVLYAMHYFNTTELPSSLVDEPGVAVKAHVDPSLLVVEPFLCPTTRGLQVWNRQCNEWLDCDGPDSSLIRYQQECHTMGRETELMLLFVGKGISNAMKEDWLEPTLHRVVSGDQPRRTVIYEQKYAAFFPPPSFD